MKKNKEYIKASERALRLNRLIYARELPVILKVLSFPNNAVTYALSHQFINNRDDYSICLKDSDEEIIIIAIKLAEPRYTQLTKVCIDMIGAKNIFLRKTKEVEIISITKDGVLLSDGRIVQADELYLKDK